MKRSILLPLSLVFCLACPAEKQSDAVDIPADIYDEDAWDEADVDVRIAALRRDIEGEMKRLASLEPSARLDEAGRVLELMSVLRGEWGKVEGGMQRYAKLEEDLDVLLEP